MKTENIIRSIKDAVKSKEELQGITFGDALSRNAAANPVCGFVLLFGFGKAQFTCDSDTLSSEFTTEIKLSLLAPSGAGGKRLSEMALWVSEAIGENLSIKSISVSEPRHRDTGNTLYCDIVVIVKEASLSDTGCSVYIGDDLADGVVLFEAETIPVCISEPELLNGQSEHLTGEVKYCIKIKSVKLMKTSEHFDLKAEYEDFYEVYGGCFVSQMKREINKQMDTTFVYTITAKDMEVVPKEVQNVR